MSTIEQRVAELERVNRHQRRILIAVGLAVLAGLGASARQAEETPGRVRARRVEIVDDTGRVAIALDAFRGAGFVRTFNSAGQVLVHLGSEARETGPRGTVTTYDGRGRRLVALGANARGDGTLTTHDIQGDELVAIGATTMGTGLLSTLDGDGHKLVLLTANRAGKGGSIHVRNQHGGSACTIHADEAGNGEIGAWSTGGGGRTLRPGG